MLLRLGPMTLIPSRSITLGGSPVKALAVEKKDPLNTSSVTYSVIVGQLRNSP